MNSNAFTNGQFKWFFAVVEDNADPLNLGRVRARPHILYTEDKSILPTDKLPWAIVVQSPTSASSFNVLEIGTQVIGFMADGEEGNTPVIIGKLNTTDSQYVGEENNKYHTVPNLARPTVEVEEDQDVATLSSGSGEDKRTVAGKLKTEYSTFKDTVVENVPGAITAAQWSEPPNPYAAVYPSNKVERSISGHVHEIDDTPGAERLHTFHKSGTFEEIHPDGQKVTKIVANNYMIVAENNNVYIQGNVNLTVDNNVNMYVKKDWNVKVDGNVNMTVRGNVNETIRGNQTTQVTGNIDIDGKRIDLN